MKTSATGRCAKVVLATAAAIAFGPFFAGIGAPMAQTTSQPSIGLTIDGTSAGYVHSASGGDAKGTRVAVAETFQGTVLRKVGEPAYSGFTVTAGADTSRTFWLLVKEALDGKEQAFDGSLVTLDSTRRIMGERDFFHALVTGVSFPTLDGSSKDAAYLSVSFEEERVQSKPGSSAIYSPGGAGTALRELRANSFRFAIDNVTTSRPMKIDAFNVTASARGTSSSIVRLTFVTNGSELAAFTSWARTGGGKNASLAFLSIDGKDTFLEVALLGSTLVKIQAGTLTASTTTVQTTTVELQPARVSLVGGTMLTAP